MSDMENVNSSLTDKSSPILISRLAVMMFLQFFIWGAWYVSLYGFCNENGMTASGAGGTYDAAAYTVAPIAAILAPLTLGLIVDRLMNTELVLAILNIVGAFLLWFAPSLAAAGAPETYASQFTHPMILCLLAYMICFMPTLGLTASLAFKHLANGEKEFPVVRVLGTIGWIAGGWAMSGCRLFTGEAKPLAEAQAALSAVKEKHGELLNKEVDEAALSKGQEAFDAVTSTLSFTDNSPYIFYAAEIASVILGIYCLTLPKTAPPARGEKISLGKIVGVDAWAMLKDKSFLVFAVASFLICIPLAGYYAKGYGFVESQGIALFGSTNGAMSTGQMSEIFFMLVMPLCFARLGVKWMLIIGMGAWAVRYGLWGWAFGQEGAMLTAPIFLGILLHGICYDFFFVTGMIYTDKKAQPKVRGQAQSLIVMLTQGLGLGIGAQLFGRWAGKCTSDEGVIDFALFWYVPAGFAIAVMVAFAILFWDRSADDIETESNS